MMVKELIVKLNIIFLITIYIIYVCIQCCQIMYNI